MPNQVVLWQQPSPNRLPKLHRKLEETLAKAGDDEVAEKCTTLLKKALRALRASRRANASPTEYARQQKQVISMALLTGEALQKLVLRTKEIKTRRTLREALGDAYRTAVTAAQETQFQLNPQTTPFINRMIVFAWSNYDSAGLDQNEYASKINQLLATKVLYALVANLRFVLVSKSKERPTLSCLEKLLGMVKTEVEEATAEAGNNETALKSQRCITSFVEYALSMCYLLKSATSFTTPGCAKTLKKPLLQMLEAWRAVGLRDVNRHFLHTTVLLTVLLAKLFATVTRCPPIDLMNLLHTPALHEVARFDFIAEERDDLWDELTGFVVRTTEVGGMRFIAMLRLLNSRPAQLV